MFIAHLIQAGEGCDYTIACGESLIKLKAKTEEGAIQELKNKIIGTWDQEEGDYEEGYHDDSELEKVTLYEVSNEITIPVEEWYEEAEKYKKEAEDKMENEAEKAEYERLKAKFD